MIVVFDSRRVVSNLLMQNIVRGLRRWIADSSSRAVAARSSTTGSVSWRHTGTRPTYTIKSLHTDGEKEDDNDGKELHPTWSGLERRLQSRVPRQRGQGVPEGRRNVKPSDEEFWYEAGVYDSTSSPKPENSSSNILGGEATCARLSSVKVDAANLPQVVQLYKTLISPVLQVQGFCGAQVFSDRATNTMYSLTLWESWGALETAVADPRYKKAMQQLSGMIEAAPTVSDTYVACCILPTTGGGDKPGNAS